TLVGFSSQSLALSLNPSPRATVSSLPPSRWQGPRFPPAGSHARQRRGRSPLAEGNCATRSWSIFVRRSLGLSQLLFRRLRMQPAWRLLPWGLDTAAISHLRRQTQRGYLYQR